MALKIIFVHEFGVADIAEIFAGPVAYPRTRKCDKLVVWVAGLGRFLHGTVETRFYWRWLSIELVVRQLLVLIAYRLDFDLVR